MSRYAVRTHDINDALGHRKYHEVLKEDRPWACALPMSEAEAHIIAFALNAVAEGYELAYITHDDSIPYEQDIGYEVYTGPTEGVAP